MDRVDLHVHSTASDGTLTPSEVVCLAKKMNLSAMALTDHDTVYGLDEALRAGMEQNIEIIPGIELSCVYLQKEIHIVGLFIDYKDENFQNKLNQLRDTRDARNEQMAAKFRDHHIPITVDALKEAYPGAILTRAHFASYLHQKGLVTSVKDAFDRYLNDHGPMFVPRHKVCCEDTIGLIHSVGGIAILAHPILYRLGDLELSKMIRHLKECGLDGIEALYSTYTPADERLIQRLAKENDLLLSGGSDFHGANKPNIRLGVGKGNLRIPYELLETLKRSRN
ncbi:MAG: PHP domain-containing protein [Lachnospiraceae bacterium]